MNTQFEAGFAEIEWTPAPGLALMGQMHERIATHARDPLCACAVALRQGNETLVIVALDVAMLANDFVNGVQTKWAAQSGLGAASLMIHTTHTHVAPVVVDRLLGGLSPGILEVLTDAVLKAAKTAVSRLEPVELWDAMGQLEHMGWNRRAMFADGTSRMYGNSTNEGFVGMEGPRDGTLPALWTRNKEGRITGVLTGFATHPNTMEGEYFYSADIPGAVRKHVRRVLGAAPAHGIDADMGVVYLTGAAGNTAPSRLDPFDPAQLWRNESGVERSGLYVAGEIARLIAATDLPMAEPQLRHERTTLQVPLRTWPAEGDEGYPQPREWAPAVDYYVGAAKAWPQRLAEHSPFEVAVSVVRLGDAVICTNPAELFVEFGLAIRQASPAAVTFISELTNGYCGYVPTAKAFSRGGYETWCAPTSQLDRSAGDRIVAATTVLLAQAFEENTAATVTSPAAGSLVAN